MSEKTGKPASGFGSAIAALRRHLLEKGNRFDYGPDYKGEGKVLASVRQTTRMYEGMGYTKLVELGNPPAYAMLQRGHREAHIFQPQDPKIREWLEDEKVALNDPAMREHMLQASGLRESELEAARKPQIFRIAEVDDVFIITSENAPPERG